MKTNESALKSIGIALSFSFFLYVGLGILSIFVFGSGISSNLLNNVNSESSVTSYIIRISFMIVLACHIPYIFYFTKESLLIMVDETRRRSMTYALELTLQKSVYSEERTFEVDSEVEQPNMTAYQNTEPTIYYGITLLLYGIIITISCFTNNVSTVFSFVSAFSTSFNVYTVPGLLYILGERKYGSSLNRDWFRTLMAWFYIVLGIFVFVIELISAIV